MSIARICYLSPLMRLSPGLLFAAPLLAASAGQARVPAATPESQAISSAVQFDQQAAAEGQTSTTRPARSPREGDVVITIVYDNNAGSKGLTTGWGFGCVVQGLEETILFDTGGDGRILLDNMRRLNLDPGEIDAVVLSHIHGDHTGGLAAFLHKRTGVPVYMPSGFPTAFKERVRSLGARPVEAADSATICRGARTTGTLGQGAIEEHGLCVQTAEGWVLITGCAHPGVAELAARAKEITAGPVCLVIGGFHMAQQPKSAINRVIDRFEELGIRRAAPCHCSGDLTRKLFKERFGEGCRLVGVGDVFELRRPTGTSEDAARPPTTSKNPNTTPP